MIVNILCPGPSLRGYRASEHPCDCTLAVNDAVRHHYCDAIVALDDNPWWGQWIDHVIQGWITYKPTWEAHRHITDPSTEWGRINCGIGWVITDKDIRDDAIRWSYEAALLAADYLRAREIHVYGCDQYGAEHYVDTGRQADAMGRTRGRWDEERPYMAEVYPTINATVYLHGRKRDRHIPDCVVCDG